MKDPLERVALALWMAAFMAALVAVASYQLKTAHVWPGCVLAAASGFYSIIRATGDKP